MFEIIHPDNAIMEGQIKYELFTSLCMLFTAASAVHAANKSTKTDHFSATKIRHFNYI